MEQANIGLVLYTDGSARPNPGNTGCGIHGYKYSETKPTKGTGLQSQTLTKYGYKPKHLAKEINEAGGEVTALKYYDLISNSEFGDSNNTAEVDALYYSLCHIPLDGVSRIYVLTDSEYTRKGLNEWLPGWKQSNWIRKDGAPISNAKNWMRLEAKVNELRGNGIEIEVAWVKGHGIDHGNIIADKLSVIGTMQMKNGDAKLRYKESEVGGYWKNEIIKHPMITHQKCYFNSISTYNTPGHYYLSDPTSPDLTCGRKTPDATYAAIRLKYPDPAMEAVKEKQYEAACDVNSIVVMRLENVFSNGVYPYLSEYGRNAFLTDVQKGMSVMFVDKTPLTVEINPVGNTFRAVENFGLLEEVLDEYNAKVHKTTTIDEKYGLSGLTVYDLTDTFYKVSEKKKGKEIVLVKELKPEYGVGHRDVETRLDINHNGETRNIIFPLTLGLDLPHRNNLKRMEDLNPKVSLVTWYQSPQVLQYVGVVETNDAVGVWANYFAGKVVLKP